jgi:hypothetical protein
MHNFSIHHLEHTWKHYGVDAPAIVGFLCGVILVLLSSDCIKRLIQNQANKTLDGLKRDPDEEEQQFEKEKRIVHSVFDWTGAGVIGILERFVYVYAVLISAYPLMAGWLAMKAFFLRLAEPEVKTSRRQPIYHTYLYGNMVSVLAGLICGHIANAISATIWKVY